MVEAASAVVALWLLLSIGPGCASLDPRCYLSNLRILAMFTDPLEVGPGDEVSIEPLVYVPDGDSVVAESWTFCPFTKGAQDGFSCVAEACEVEIVPEPDGTIRATPSALVADCYQAMAALSDLPPGLPSEPPARVDVVFRYRVALDDGFFREAIVSVPVWLRGPPPERNRRPIVASVEVEGRDINALPDMEPDEELVFQARIDPDSLDSYTDPAGQQRTEEPFVSFYATAGRFEYDWTFGVETTNTWKPESLEDDEDEADFWVVVHDGRGGQSASGSFHVRIQP